MDAMGLELQGSLALLYHVDFGDGVNAGDVQAHAHCHGTIWKIKRKLNWTPAQQFTHGK